MDEETRRRCLEPFFTTKGERGTGLGLAMVYGMVQRHSAALEIDSKPGAGTTIRLLFPVGAAASASAAPVLRRRRRPQLAHTDRGRRSGVDRIVARDASRGRASGDRGRRRPGRHRCLRNARRTAEPFDIVITDLGMPYVDGRQVVASVRAAAPDTPIIMLTGWGQRLQSDNEQTPQVDRLLSKPPRLQELRKALAELTSGRQGR